jgi:WD40 repeat protein
MNVRRTFNGHATLISDLTLAPDEKYLYSSSYDKSVIQWNINLGRPEMKWIIDEYYVSFVKPTMDNRYLIAGSFSGSIAVFSLESRQTIATLKHHLGPLCGLGLSSCGRYLASASNEHNFTLWTLSDDFTRQVLTDISNKIMRCYLCNNPSEIVSASPVAIKKWNMKTGRSKTILEQENLFFICTTISASKLLLYIGLTNGKIVTWNLSLDRFIGEFQAHSGKVSSMKCSYGDTYIVSGGSDYKIKLWDGMNKTLYKEVRFSGEPQRFVFTRDNLKVIMSDRIKDIYIFRLPTLDLLATLKYNSDVYTMDLSYTGTFLVTGSTDKTIRIWDLDIYHCEGVLKSHTAKVNSVLITHDEQYIVSGSDDCTIKFWSMKDKIELCSISMKNIIQHISFIEDHKKLIASSAGVIMILDNPLAYKNKPTVIPHEYSLFFLHYIKSLEMGACSHYVEEMNKYTVMPYHTNILHIYSYESYCDFIKLAMKAGVPFIRTSTGETPLTISLRTRGNVECIDTIIKKLATFTQYTQPNVLAMIEEHISQLNIMSIPSLHLLYSEGFQEVKSDDVFKYGAIKSKSPISQLSRRKTLNPSKFVEQPLERAEKPRKSESIYLFRTSNFRVPLNIGAKDSIEFMYSLSQCENSEVFKTLFIKAVLEYKWARVKKMLIGQAFIFATELVLLCYYSIYSKNFIVLITALSLNTFFFIYEIFQMSYGLLDYILDIWNVIDILRIILLYIYGSYIIFGWEMPVTESIPLLLLILLVWLRFISYFRIFNKTRYLIRMIREVISDMVPFLLVLAVTTFALGMLFVIANSNKSLESDAGDIFMDFLHAWRIALGDFDTDKYNTYEWVVFVLGSMLNTMVMLNLIIAIMGDTYDRVQAGMEVADAKELTLLIIEIESIMFWQRINREAKYLHYCYPREIAQADYNNKWSGKIMVLRKAIKDIELRIKSNDKKIDAFGGAIKEMRDELIIVQNRNEKTLEQQINSLKSTLLNPRHSDGSNKLQGQKDSENPNESEISSLRSEIEKLNSKLDLLLNK